MMPENRPETGGKRSTVPNAEREQFQPGQSGNPGGRPKVIAEVRALAQQYTALAIETLVHIMQHGSTDAARVA